MYDNSNVQTNSGYSDFFVRYNKTENGIIWFICFLPLIGLFLENYATSKYVGIFLWTLIIILMPICCFADLKKLTKAGYNTQSLKKWIWLSPVYVFNRERLTGRDVNKSIMLGFFIIAAIALNGFTQSIRTNGDSLTESLKNTPVSYLDNFSGSSQNIIGTQIENYLGDSAKWTNEKHKNYYVISVSGKKDNDKITIDFKIKYDGYVSSGLSVSEIKLNGKKLTGDEYKALLRKIFIPETIENKSDGSQASSDSSQT